MFMLMLCVYVCMRVINQSLPTEQMRPWRLLCGVVYTEM